MSLLDTDDDTLRDRMERSPNLLLAEVRRMQAGIARLRLLHAPDGPENCYPSCRECTHGCGVGDVDWPCETLRALDAVAPESEGSA